MSNIVILSKKKKLIFIVQNAKFRDSFEHALVANAICAWSSDRPVAVVSFSCYRMSPLISCRLVFFFLA